jgi:hypothetical protein
LNAISQKTHQISAKAVKAQSDKLKVNPAHNYLYPKRRNRYLKKRSKKALTICIASICENNTGNPRIVFCADRLITDYNGLTFEQAEPKIVQLLPNCLIMNAGDAACGDAIIRDVFEALSKVKPETMSIKDIAELIKTKYDNLRQQMIDEDIFKPRGFDRNFFYSNLKSFPDWLALTIDKEVSKYDFDVAFIILGFDINQESKSGVAHLYQLDDEGGFQFLTPIGFSMVGIGSYQSLPEITKEPYSQNTSLSDALVRVFWAKKLSERMVSVGRESTDLGFMYLELDKDTDKIIAKNTLLTDDFKNKVLREAFEHQKEVMKKMTNEVQQNITEVFQGKRAIGQTNP